jgi:hypothetical protein
LIEQLISRVFYTRNVAHWIHWRTKSYSEHKALGSFYEDVLEALDDLVEAYQGAYELVGNIPAPDPNVPEILEHLENEAKWIEENHEKICKGNRAVANLIDALSSVYLSTIYKLRNLK